jgi:hypothetical protein
MIQIFDAHEIATSYNKRGAIGLLICLHMETKRSQQALWSNQTMECECYRWKQESAIHSETYTQEFE